MINYESIQTITFKLLDNIEKANYQGYDPYDLLNSKINFKVLGPKVCFYLSQIHKRNPLDIRKFLLIPKSVNPKGLGLLLEAYSNLYKLYKSDDILNKMHLLFERLLAIHSKGFHGYCWGLDFNYANRYELLPSYSPSIVVTSFVCNGIFEYYLVTNNSRAIEVLKSSCDFALKDLYITKDDDKICFSYTTTKRDITFNANALAAELFSKVYYITKDENYKNIAKAAIDFNIKYQKNDGSWNYQLFNNGNEKKQIDFHQGFILNSLFNFIRYTSINDGRYLESLQIGANFYFNRQFSQKGWSYWRIPKKWPIDIHNQAQGIITFTELYKLNHEFYSFAQRIAEWTIENMLGRNGLFYYRISKFHKNKIPYLRWNQIWMLLALSKLLLIKKKMDDKYDS